MTERHKIGSDGLRQDSVSTYPASLTDQVIYAQTQEALARLPTPTIYNNTDPHQRVFIALFDGTGNDATHDPEHRTNVGEFSEQLRALQKRGSQVGLSYIEGPGTQEKFIPRTLDGIRGYTYEARLEEMYDQLIRQSSKWLQEDPQAQIRIIETGFSRGADQAAGFARMVHERGIQNIDTLVRSPNGGPPTFNGPALVEPGKIPQAVALFDPVGTGVPQHHSRQLPPSVVSGFQIVARDERRNLFPSTQIIPQGLSSDGRFLGVTVPGAHSDIGGSYHLNGLGVLNGNLMTDYINRLSATPLLERQPEPTDPRMYVIHRSEEHLPIYRTSAYDHDGQRDVMGAQISPPHCRKVITCAAPEPVDEALLATLPTAFAPSREAPSPVLEASDTTSLYVSPTQDLSAYLDRMLVASQSGNDAEFRQMTQTLADLPPGRAMREEAIVTVDRQEQWQMDQQRAQTIEAPMMRMHH
jgi:hypothetical protein